MGGARRGIRAHAQPPSTPLLTVWSQVPYFWAGLKAYDAVAGTSALAWSHYLSATASREIFPTLLSERPDGDTLKGSVSSCGSILVFSVALTLTLPRRLCITTAR
jgi:hypothetical protein